MKPHRRRSHMAYGQVNRMTTENPVSAYPASFTFEPQAQIHGVMWSSSILHKYQVSKTEVREKFFLRPPPWRCTRNIAITIDWPFNSLAFESYHRQLRIVHRSWRRNAEQS
uniref:Uncharacterized protein n=1 Tax=Ditylenchus dipsaci TaxID=166011 RepID=A0A915EJ95_9BILA